MAYAVQSDISDRYGSEFLLDIADRSGNGSIDGAELTAVSKALDDASATIDSYVSLKFDDPASLDPQPPAFVRWCVDIACYYLASENRGSLTKVIEERHDRAVAELEKVAAGKLGLGVADPPGTVGCSTILSCSTRQMRFEDTGGVV